MYTSLDKTNPILIHWIETTTRFYNLHHQLVLACQRQEYSQTFRNSTSTQSLAAMIRTMELVLVTLFSSLEQSFDLETLQDHANRLSQLNHQAALLLQSDDLIN